eukprot:1773130-Ditylum_brightwellii.AAC.1
MGRQDTMQGMQRFPLVTTTPRPSIERPGKQWASGQCTARDMLLLGVSISGRNDGATDRVAGSHGVGTYRSGAVGGRKWSAVLCAHCDE